MGGIEDIIVEFADMEILFTNKVSFVAIVVLSTLLVNLSIVWHKDRIIEYKVSVYFVLALASTVSYFLFLINYFVRNLTIIGFSLEEFIKVITLPYLISNRN